MPTCAVHSYQPHRQGGQAAGQQRSGHERLLCRSVGRGEAAAAAVLVDGAAAQDSTGGALSSYARLRQQDHGKALAPPVPISRGVKRLAAAHWAECLQLADAHSGFPPHHHVDAARQRSSRLGAQDACSEGRRRRTRSSSSHRCGVPTRTPIRCVTSVRVVHCDQAAAARSVDAVAGALQPIGVRYTAALVGRTVAGHHRAGVLQLV